MNKQQIVLDGRELLTRVGAHIYLQQVFALPAHYGRNLDALFDCLFEVPACHVTVQNSDVVYAQSPYGERILSVLQAVCDQREDFSLQLL